MATFADMQSEIADDIDDTTGEYASQIQRAIIAAIRYCQRDNYWFNELRTGTIATAVGEQFYTFAGSGSASGDFDDVIQINDVFYTDAGGQSCLMTRISPVEMELLSDSSASVGQPFNWTYYQSQLWIYPIPDQAYTLELHLGPYRYVLPSLPSDTHAFFDEAWDMVKARAKYIIQKDTLRDPAMAMEALNDFKDQQTALAAETSRRVGTGTIKATCF